MYNVYNGDWPPGDWQDHPSMKMATNPGFAWKEGWADFFALVINGNPVFTWPTGHDYDIDLEEPTWDTSDWDDGDEVEGRVAGTLWDIYDTPNDEYDHFADGFTNIWDTVYNQNDDTFAEFWDAWKARGHNRMLAHNAIYQNTIFSILLGDANQDGAINACDITKVERIVGGLDPPVPEADLNQDGAYNALDITLVEVLVAMW